MKATRLLASAILGSWLAASALPAWAADPPVFHIVAREGRLQPARLDVPANTKIKLTIQNAGNGPIEFENLDLRVEKVLAPGASSFVIIRALKPGSYRFFDEFHPNTSEMFIIAK